MTSLTLLPIAHVFDGVGSSPLVTTISVLRYPGYLSPHDEEAPMWTTGKSVFDSRQRQDPFLLSVHTLAPTQPLIQRVPRVTRQNREAGHSPLSIIEVNIAGSIVPHHHKPS
jgi:hypothetical protein